MAETAEMPKTVTGQPFDMYIRPLVRAYLYPLEGRKSEGQAFRASGHYILHHQRSLYCFIAASFPSCSYRQPSQRTGSIHPITTVYHLILIKMQVETSFRGGFNLHLIRVKDGGVWTRCLTDIWWSTASQRQLWSSYRNLLTERCNKHEAPKSIQGHCEKATQKQRRSGNWGQGSPHTSGLFTTTIPLVFIIEDAEPSQQPKQGQQHPHWHDRQWGPPLHSLLIP